MPPFFRRPIWSDLATWILVAAALASVVWALSYFGQAVDLSMTAHLAGQGNVSMYFTGSAMNVSILQNGTGWDVVVSA